MVTCREQHADLLEALILLRQKESSWSGLGDIADGSDVICPLLGDEDILWFETQCAVTLAPAYRLYLQLVGDGWPAAVGRMEGLYPLGHGLGDDPGELPAFGLARPCVITPSLAAEAWAELQAALLGLAPEDAGRRAEVLVRVYGGLLPVGSHGRACVHCLVLNGPHTGRIVDIDPAGHTAPAFAPETDFLRWCVRFLHEAFGMKLPQLREAVV
jgi:hypothetical protein